MNIVDILILENFKNTHNKKRYIKDTLTKVTEKRYNEIVENMKKINKKLVRKATPKDIKKYDYMESIEEVEEVEND